MHWVMLAMLTIALCYCVHGVHGAYATLIHSSIQHPFTIHTIHLHLSLHTAKQQRCEPGLVKRIMSHFPFYEAAIESGKALEPTRPCRSC
ncbi:hypothetical protein F4806DRAFT_173935 [Annulohypoxylon nitens]|nr:hypothetical protein F4806DRAFT_173935 [Annulohypoxylon nitens]